MTLTIVFLSSNTVYAFGKELIKPTFQKRLVLESEIKNWKRVIIGERVPGIPYSTYHGFEYHSISSDVLPSTLFLSIENNRDGVNTIPVHYVGRFGNDMFQYESRRILGNDYSVMGIGTFYYKIIVIVDSLENDLIIQGKEIQKDVN
jgi:hypothetical protein